MQSSHSILLILLDACLPVGAVTGLSRTPPCHSSSIPCQTSDQNLIRSRRHLSPSPPSITDVRLLFSPLFSSLPPRARFTLLLCPSFGSQMVFYAACFESSGRKKTEGVIYPSLLVVLGADLAQVSDRTQPGME